MFFFSLLLFPVIFKPWKKEYLNTASKPIPGLRARHNLQATVFVNVFESRFMKSTQMSTRHQLLLHFYL